MKPRASEADAIPLIRRLLEEEGSRHIRDYVVAFVCMVVMAATTALAAYLMKNVINEIFIDRTEGAVWWLAGTIVALYAAKGAATYWQTVTLSRVTNAIVASNQIKLFQTFMRQDMAGFTSTHSTELVNRFQTGATAIATALNLVVTSIGRDVFTLVGLAIVMIVQDARMSLGALVIMPIAIFGIRSLVRRVRKVRQKGYGLAGEILETLQEGLQGIRVIKSFRLETLFEERMAAAALTAKDNADKLAMVAARSSPLMETLGGFAIAFVIAYGGYRVIESGQTPGEFFSFITALLLAYEPAKRLARFNIDLNTALVGVRILFDALDTQSGEAERPGKKSLAVSEGEIVFEGVTFSYRPGEPVLHGLSFVAGAGRTTALVGESGGGKSTVVALLQRFYMPEAGTITIDGQDIRAVSLPSLRDQIGVVGQETFLFGGTVRDNIAMGKEGASDAEILAAATAANAHGFIMELPQRYGTPVGERGASLSGGQRQRIAIARAILKNAPIILLDEATAALDNESEKEVQAALRILSADRTTIVIAHRLNTVRDADVIHVIERGRIVETGSHMALLAAGGRYRALYETMLRETGES